MVASDEKNRVAAAVDESTGDAVLDEKLSHPVFTFDSGFEQAQAWMCGFLIVVAGLMAYSNAFRIPFHADDLRWLCNNDAAHALTTTPQAVAEGSPSLMTFLDLALDWRLVGESPLLYHVSSLCLHLANGVLLFLLCRALLGAGAAPVISMLAGMLLVLHPLATESVVTAIGRESVLSGTFMLAGLVLYLRGTREETYQDPGFGTSSVLLAFSCVSFALGAATSTAALVFPFVVTSLSLCAYPQRTWRAHAVALVPSWFVFAALWAFCWVSGFRGLRVPDFGLAWYALNKTVAPMHLSAVPQFGTMPWALLVLPLILGVIISAFKRIPGLVLVWMSAVLMAGTATHAAPSERVAYLCVAGAALLVPWLITAARPAGVRAVLGIACAGLVLAAGAGTYLRNMVWQDAASLWADAQRQAPNSAVPLRNLGMTFLHQAKGIEDENPAEATRLYGLARDGLQQALDKLPDDIDTREALGTALMKSGEVDGALEAFRAVLRADLNRRVSSVSVANMLFGRFTEKDNPEDLVRAIEYFRHAELIRPLTGSDLTRYGLALSARGDFEIAEPLLERAALGSDSEQAGTPLKNARELARRVRGLLGQSTSLLGKNPKDVAGLRLRLQGLALRGQTMSAFYALDGLMHAQPPDYSLWLMMGLLRARMNRMDAFLSEWPSPPAPPEGAPPAWIELARTVAGSGLWSAARAYVEAPQAAGELGERPLLALAEVALQFKQGRRAFDCLNDATKAYPTDPAAWLRLCDIANASRDGAAAQNYLREAETRNADPAEVEKRKKLIAGTSGAVPAPGTIVQ